MRFDVIFKDFIFMTINCNEPFVNPLLKVEDPCKKIFSYFI